MKPEDDIFIGRQPILDREQKVVAYELLFRGAATADRAVFTDYRTASTRVIVNTFMTMGAQAVLGDCAAFVNVGPSMLEGDLVRALPADRAVIEILENVEPSESIRRCCRELREAGFRIALDDYVVRDPRESLLPLVDVVKIDLLAVAAGDLRRLTRQLRRHPVQLLAEKVEAQEDFERCLELGFDLFQGYFFAKPVVLTGRSLDPARSVLLQLLGDVERDSDTARITDTAKRHVNVGVNLLNLVNSAAMARPHKIARIEDAVNFLGRKQLQRWITILLFAGDSRSGIGSPLLETAAHRGRLMELVSERVCEGASPAEHQRAFLVGMLSLIDTLLGRPKAELLGQINIDEAVVSALLKHEGALGSMLSLVEAIEAADFDAVDSLCARLGLSIAELQASEDYAYAWVHGLMHAHAA